jgi:hypothetical protein
MTPEQIEAMKEKYQSQRDALIDEANRQIAMLDGAIAAMEAQLAQLAAEASPEEGAAGATDEASPEEDAPG